MNKYDEGYLLMKVKELREGQFSFWKNQGNERSNTAFKILDRRKVQEKQIYIFVNQYCRLGKSF